MSKPIMVTIDGECRHATEPYNKTFRRIERVSVSDNGHVVLDCHQSRDEDADSILVDGVQNPTITIQYNEN